VSTEHYTDHRIWSEKWQMWIFEEGYIPGETESTAPAHPGEPSRG
jgi:hypothetical protein